jgi:signal transduction histidine kinase
VSILADALLSVLYLSRYDHLREAVQTNVTVMVVLKLVYLLIMAALFYWLRYILCKRIRQLPQKLEWGLPLTLLPLNQAIILDILLYVVQTAPRAQWNFLLLGLAGGATVIVDLIFFTAWKKRQREQVLQEQLRLTERQMETQMRYYRKIRENMSLVNQIRHDLNNQLQTAYSLLQSDHADAARAQLDEIRANLGKKAGAEYCENPVVNAVLAEKAEICREQDISLDAKACVPPQIPVQSAHLCAILANLLDNAIAAAQKAEKPWIELNVSVRAGCLLFCCTNVCAGQKASKKAAEEELLPIHGVGMSILRRVAAFYQGDVQIHREDDRFHAIVMLPFSKKPELERGDFCAGRK